MTARGWRGWVAPAAWAVVILVGSSLPGTATGPLPVSDKIPHFLEYLVLALLFARTLARPVVAAPAAWALALAGLLAFAGIDEAHQALIPGRSPDPLDWVADAAGVACGISIGALWAWRRGTKSA